MTAWPAGDDGGVPSPEVVAALLALDQLPAERVPWWAAAWLADGIGASATAEIAGLNGRDPRAVRDLLPAVLGELNVPVPGTASAAATLAFSHLARLCLRGVASPYWVVQKVEEIVICNDGGATEIIALPLGQLYGLTDEWGRGWGRTREALSALVRAACVSQLALDNRS